MTTYVPVLTFHSLDTRSSVTSFPPQLFRGSMGKLHDAGYQTVSLLEAVDCLSRGMPFPQRAFVITFDDGYQTVYDEAFPVLQRYGMSATVFLTVGEHKSARRAARLPSIAGHSMLSWCEIREMQQGGISFGAHTLTHPDLTRIPLDQVAAEVCDSKAIIEDALDAPVPCFAYPYGRYDDRSRDIVRRHFACACSDELGLVTTGSDPHALKRVDAYYLRSERLFDVMLTRRFPWYIGVRSIPRRIRRAARPGHR
jgi:peptidoglycan/xylan/chitin deacetylase (PgdA/CDA1 family)